MLAIILSWICISLVFISFGDFLAFIYNKFTKQNEKYPLTDLLFLGMIFTITLVSISSLWLPSNHYILGIYILLSVAYWIVRREHLIEKLNKWKEKRHPYSASDYLFFGIIVSSFILLSLWVQKIDFDTIFYHHAGVRWNEDFAVVPGLGNLEERLGFNSNYLLLSALFSLRFIFADPIIGLQSLMAVFVMVWIVSEVIKSDYDLVRVILLALYLFFIMFYVNKMNETSTDIIPNLVIMYLGAKAILHPDAILKQKLLYALLPVCMITFKISGVFSVLFTIYIFIILFKEKNYRPILFISALSLIIIAVWLIRNVIVSGYLVHPIYQIDLFSFDWKIPQEVVMRESAYIENYAWGSYKTAIQSTISNFSLKTKHTWRAIICLAYILSIIYSSVKLIRKRKQLPNSLIIVFFTLLVNILYAIIAAPTLRFIFGYVIVILFCTLYLLFHKEQDSRIARILSKLDKKDFFKAGKKTVFVCLIVFLSLFSIRWAYQYKAFIGQTKAKTNSNSWKYITYKPFSVSESFTLIQMDNQKSGERALGFEPYTINNNITLFVSTDKRGFAFDKIPAVSTLNDFETWVFQDYRDLEARGTSLQDGFRSTVLKQE